MSGTPRTYTVEFIPVAGEMEVISEGPLSRFTRQFGENRARTKSSRRSIDLISSRVKFKQEAVRMVTQQGLSPSEVASRLGISADRVRQWKKVFASPGTVPPRPSQPNALEEVKRLTMEREIFSARGKIICLGQSHPARRGPLLVAAFGVKSDGPPRAVAKPPRGLREGAAVRFQFIEVHREVWPISTQCEVQEVSRSGYYAWRKRPVSAQPRRRADLIEHIQEIHARPHHEVCGSPRVHRELVKKGHACNRKTVAKCMKAAGIQASTVKKFKVVTTDSNHHHPVAENIVDRDFSPSKKNETWTADKQPSFAETCRGSRSEGGSHRSSHPRRVSSPP